MINFYADWCGNCRHFAPTWIDFENKVNGGEDVLKDADGVRANVRLMRINCVDFEDTCMQQSIRMFPSVRLYRRAAKKGTYEEFRGSLGIDGLRSFLTKEVAKRHTHTGAHFHSMFNEGCRITGHVEASRVPGTLHFQAQNSADRMFNPAFTNVSHMVHHLSFGEAPRRSIFSLPSEYKRHVNPLDGRTFIADKFHKAPHHFIKVVHTRFEETGLRSYQQTHQWSLRTLQRNTVPQAKFSYDLSPVEVVISKGERRWYDFLTQVLAIIGGAFSVMSMAMGILKVSQVQLKVMMNKMG
jgi:thiol-disulfide isomerase/thioredoxin